MSVKTPLVRRGEDFIDPKGHSFARVYGEMLGQIVKDYSSLGDFRRLTPVEIRFFYDMLRGQLKAETKPNGKTF